MTIMDSRPVTHTSTPALTGGQLEVSAYFEFLYGWGVAPGVDLGALGAYSKVDTAGTVFRQDYERGIGIGNLGDDVAIVTLEHPYIDMNGKVVTTVTVPGHSVKVLVNDR